jgi:hypothetical protein
VGAEVKHGLADFKKVIIDSPAHGEMAFTVPLFETLSQLGRR